jgi:hypothetical protein
MAKEIAGADTMVGSLTPRQKPNAYWTLRKGRPTRFLRFAILKLPGAAQLNTELLLKLMQPHEPCLLLRRPH